MSYVQNFSISQSGLSPDTITAENTSTGTDAAITSLRIYFQTPYGTYLVVSGTTTDYEAWALANASQSFAVLNQDWALSIRVDWLDVSDTVLYTLTQVFCFPQFNKNFFYYLQQQGSLTPSVIQDTNYFANMATYWMSITGAIQSVVIGADIASSQACLDRATNMMNNQNLYF